MNPKDQRGPYGSESDEQRKDPKDVVDKDQAPGTRQAPNTSEGDPRGQQGGQPVGGDGPQGTPSQGNDKK